MRNPIQIPVNRDGDGISHTPNLVKGNEQEIAYNPFFIDVVTERPRLDPEWAQRSGIILNWLLRDLSNGPGSFLLGVEANSPENMKRFMDEFSPGHGMTLREIRNLTMLGHPTLACKIMGNQINVSPVNY